MKIKWLRKLLRAFTGPYPLHPLDDYPRRPGHDVVRLSGGVAYIPEGWPISDEEIKHMGGVDRVIRYGPEGYEEYL